MSDRFQGLDRFLPPAPREVEPDTASGKPALPAARRRSGRRLPALITATTLLGTAAMGAAVMLATPRLPGNVSEPSSDAVAGVSQGRAASRALEPDRERDTERPVTRKRSRRSRPVTRRMRIASAGEPTSSTTDPVVLPDGPPKRDGGDSSREKTVRERAEPALPPPPQHPLFHCSRSDKHWMTIDEARVGQLEGSRSRWTCAIVGYVYESPTQDTRPLELHDGTAYVFADKGVRTDPACTVHVLNKHWAGYEWWYSTRPADGGFSGYLCV